ncbi:E3 ubiquitin-protein ligase RNF128-like isoform X3 [Penaeus monodon]|uniref:E3 ubiquitin-protein ligase RNF128-like isoform X3 n=1 Tax=Penaeus monodon TaxID=6687 RepID=UPI0018A71C56|nr:E3 ubiquitin-protein ligase RNF128-like isoform X3 [Penaeus monodon]
MLRVWALTWLWVAGCARAFGSEWSYEGATITLANLNISYSDPATGMNRTDVGEVGKFGSGAVGVAAGILIVGHSLDGGDPRHNRHGCKMPWAVVPPNEPWVALVSRGECADREKIANAQALNASAILVYAKDAQEHLQKIALSSFSRHIYTTTLQRLQRYPVMLTPDTETRRVVGGERGVVVFLAHQQGEQLARMVENGTKVYVSITRGEDVKYRVTSINRTSVLFVSVSFIILMVISLAWLIFYYIQRFRYIHAKDRLARHLCNAAKKALSKIPVKNLKSGDKEVVTENECCAVCIEPYQVSDTVRTLPCKHEFHKSCVDPWLLEHRTCPMCKMDILKFYGFVFSGSTETVVPMDDHEMEFELSLSGSEESVLQLDMLEDTSGGDIEARAPTPPPPVNPRSSHVSQVMVVPRAETSVSENSCDGWSETPVPDTPISPVHQPQNSAPPPGSATSSVLRSVLGSARSRASQSARVSQSSQTTASATVSRLSRPPTPQSEKGESRKDEGLEQGQDCDAKSEAELASVCSDDFSDALSTHSAAEITADDSGITCPNENTDQVNVNINVNSATNCIYVLPYENTSESVTAISATSSVPSSAQTHSSSTSQSPSRKSSVSSRRSTLHSRSSPKKRSTSRTRSISRRRSSSRTRSPSRGRPSRQESPSHSALTVASRSGRVYSRPSSHIVSVSHV